MLKKFIIVITILILFAAGCATDTPDRENARETAGETIVSTLENFRINETEEPEDGDIKPFEQDIAEPAADEPEIDGSAAEPPVNEEIPYINTAKQDGFIFMYKNADVVLGAFISDVLNDLGPERDYYEYPSCAFEGDARIFVYDGFEVATYLLRPNDYDRLYSITFFDDGVATAEGVRIGQGYGDMTAAYGMDYEEIPGSFLYEKGGTILSFTVENGEIAVITYYVADIYG